MGLIDRIKNVTGGSSAGYGDDFDDTYYDNFDEYGEGVDDDQGGIGGMNQSNIGNMGNAGSMGGISLSGSGTALEMKVVKPQQFDSVTQIADHLLNKRTVVLNLESTSKETARRLIDFLSGVAYSIDGSIKKIASNAYVITPSNVDVGDGRYSAGYPRISTMLLPGSFTVIPRS